MVSNFLFHRVNHERDDVWDPMDIPLFEKCIKYIANNYEVMQLEELVTTKTLPKGKIATIVFDDGYKDNIENAAPILQKYNCKASFYIVTDCIDKNVPTWTYNLDYSFQNTNITEIDLTLPFLPRELMVTQLASRSERIDYTKKLKPFLKKLTHEEREIVLTRISTTYTDITLPEIMMNWKDIKQLHNAGHYIGSHTATHAMLGTISNEDDLKNELIWSGNRIKQELGYFPKTISYPIGSYNQKTIDVSKKAGYTIGLAVRQKIYNPLTDDIFEIPRIELYNEPWWKTKMRIKNLFERIKSTIRYR